VSDYLPPSEEYSANLVVDRPHRDFVSRLLDEYAGDLVTVDAEVDDSADLDLCRFRLTDVRAFGRGGPPADGAVIEVVLERLRRVCRDAFGGWVPEMDGDATVTGIVGYPHTRPMSFISDLVVADAADFGLIPDQGAGKGVRVGMLDTALIEHPQLKGHASPAEGGRQGLPTAAWTGHATFVAGLIAKEAPGCEIVVHGVLNDQGRAGVWKTAVELAEMAKADPPYDVVNLSLGCRMGGPHGPLALRRAVERHPRRTLLVAASGNHGGSLLHATMPAWPAAFPGVVAVGATHVSGGRPELSTITPRLPWVDCVAVGSGVTSTYIEGTFSITNLDGQTSDAEFHQYATWGGTSFAAAKVSGAVAAALRPGESTATTYARLLDTPGSGVSRPPW
jgi:subtilisin family serine protease